jgi:endonuclease/exonuclease/phosphatase family metal-dependent hydrolase
VELCTHTTPALPVVPAAEREALRRLPRSLAAHARLQASLPALHQVEAAPPPRLRPAAAALRVVAWNVERGGDPEGAARRLATTGADVLLLSELDVGMARSGQRHTIRELAGRLGMGFAFGVEFLELGLGNAEESARCAGQTNAVGYHGGAIASTHPLERPALVRLDAGGDWFDGRRGERRVGGRVAILATLRLASVPVTLASLHLESHGDPGLRDAQVAALLEALDAYAPGAPALLGGDLNTHSLGIPELEDRAALTRALRADPGRLARPFAHEPLFARLEAAGFEWRRCNAVETSTQRRRKAEGGGRGALHLDWLLARGLPARDAEVHDGTDPSTGAPLSDHEPISARVGSEG